MKDVNSAGESRRNFIIGTAAAGVTALFPSFVSPAQNTVNPRRIDVHHHFEPEVFVAYRRAHNQGGPNAGWNVNKAIEEMGKGGVETLSVQLRSKHSRGTVEEYARQSCVRRQQNTRWYPIGSKFRCNR
jgi:hypothetical protein